MLLDDIVDILSDENGSLNNALLKTKVLLHTIGKKELVPWVDNEIKGYPDDDGVPEYRSVDAYVYGQVQSFTQIHHHYLVPLLHLDEDLRESLTEFKLLLPIDQIQQAVSQHKAGSSKILGKPIAPEICTLLSGGLESAHVITAKSELNMNQVAGILQEVRSRLLEFMLELRDVVGVDASNKELVSKATGFDTDRAFAEKILGNATFGANATVIIGNQNTQINVMNRKGDMNGLLAELGRIGITEKLRDELKAAIEEDEKNQNTVDVTEGRTSKWYLKALKEGGKGVYRVGIDVASKMIIGAIEHYAKGA